MPIGNRARKWETVVRSELARIGVPLPVNLILSVIDVESRGKPGIVNPKSGASGLLQVMPVALADYNKAHTSKISIDDLRDPQNPMAQIRVGVWTLVQFWRGAYRYLRSRLSTVPMDELLRIADLFYVAGPGAAKKKLAKVPTPTFSAVAERWPNWNALPHTIRVQNKVSDEKTTFDLAAISDWLSSGKGGSSIDDPLTKKEGAAIALIILIVGWLLLKKR